LQYLQVLWTQHCHPHQWQRLTNSSESRSLGHALHLQQAALHLCFALASALPLLQRIEAAVQLHEQRLHEAMPHQSCV
jgi:hypothetical protein